MHVVRCSTYLLLRPGRAGRRLSNPPYPLTCPPPPAPLRASVHPRLPAGCRHCNRAIISKVQQVICFAFHDSRLLLETCHEAKDMRKIVTLLYLD